VNRALRAHANVDEDGGCGPGDGDCDDGLRGRNRNLAPGKHGMLFLLPLGFAASTSASAATGDSSSDTRGGGGLRRRRAAYSVSVVNADEHEKPLLLDDVDDSDEDPVDDAYPEWRGRATPASRRRLPAAHAACCLGLLPASAVAHQNCGGAVAFSTNRRRGAASAPPSPSSRERQMASRSEAEKDPLDVCRTGGGCLLPHWPRRCSMSKKNCTLIAPAETTSSANSIKRIKERCEEEAGESER
jgi:hypothetical protein